MAFPFEGVTNSEFVELMNCSSVFDNLSASTKIKDYLIDISKNELLQELDCKYYTTSEFSTKFSTVQSSIEISVMHLNIRSLNSKTRAFCTFINLLEFEFDIIILSEIWSYNIDFYSKLLHGYSLYTDLPENSNVGGIGIFVSDSLNCKVRNDLRLPKLANYRVEDLWLEVVKNKRTYIIGGIYRHPNQNIGSFTSLLESTLTKIKNFNSQCIIAGDMNLDLIKTDSIPDISHYLNTILLNNCFPVIVLPTRINSKSSTLIDHIYYKAENNGLNADTCLLTGNILTDLSDHLCSFIIIPHKTKTVCASNRPMIRLFTERNKNNFNSKLDAIDWCSEFESSCDVNTCYEKFISKIQKVYEECFPYVRMSRRAYKDKQWVTKAIKVSSHKKDLLYKKWLETKNTTDEFNYKTYRRVYKKVLHKAQTTYYEKIFDAKTSNMKQLWVNLNRVCNARKDRKNNNGIDKLQTDKGVITSPVEIGNAFNRFFSNIGHDLAKTLPATSKNFTDYFKTANINSIFVEPITKTEILIIIGKLKNKKSHGNDGINVSLVKDNKHLLCTPLEILYNLSLKTGQVPDKLKIAKVIPLFKKGDKDVISNYRPISILSVFNKILEKLVYNRVYNFLQNCNLLYNYQFGFRKNYSTSLALLDTLDGCYTNIDNKNYVLGIYLDVAKAFDSVDHQILLHKLYSYGIRGVMHDWFRNYLTNRKLYTVVNNHSSDYTTMTCGIPQGSVLGPLLFLIYINDIHESVTKSECKLNLFADDTNLFIYGSDLAILETRAQCCLSKIIEWFNANKLSVNACKTCYTIFTPKGKLCSNNAISLFINGKKLTQVSCIKYLGVYIDENLKFDIHIDNICKKIVKFAGIFYKLRCVLPFEILRQLYFAFVYPHVLYGVEVYANTCKTHITKLHMLNNKLLRILLNKKFDSPSKELYLATDTLPIPQLHDMQMLILTFKGMYYKDIMPDIFHPHFTTADTIHPHVTRQNSTLFRNPVRTCIGERCIKFHCAKLWNSLPLSLRQFSTLNVFKTNIKKHLLLSIGANN